MFPKVWPGRVGNATMMVRSLFRCAIIEEIIIVGDETHKYL